MATALKLGDTGRPVAHLQGLLGAAGFPLINDGWYGDQTERAVMLAQIHFGLVPDGIAGPKTLHALERGKRDPRHLTLGAIDQAAIALNVPRSRILAINRVESTGRGFLEDGRCKILYERHVMYRQLEHYGQPAAELADRYPALVNPRRGGYMGGAYEHGRLKSARMIHDGAAVESCSWGAYQIMGHHWSSLGYESIDQFELAMQSNEDAHLDALVRFVLADDKLHKAIQAGKWSTVARLYNGPAYAANAYDMRLSAADAHFSRINEA